MLALNLVNNILTVEYNDIKCRMAICRLLYITCKYYPNKGKDYLNIINKYLSYYNMNITSYLYIKYI